MRAKYYTNVVSYFKADDRDAFRACQASLIELVAKIVKKLLNVFMKGSNIDFCHGL